jgi:predicted peptidase
MIYMPTFASSVDSPLTELEDPKTFAALVYTPPQVTREQPPLPLLLYLHGAGESGTRLWDIISEGATGTPPVELHFGRALPALAEQFVVVAPQTSSGWPAERVQAFMRFLLSTELPCRLDPRRCYVTGHSMGGSGALNAGTTGCFAAVAPVAAGGGSVSGLKGVPVWLFHGANDAVLPVRCSESAAASLKALNGEALVKYTRYEVAPDPPGYPHATGHASTIPAYATEELYTWLLSHSKT